MADKKKDDTPHNVRDQVGLVIAVALICFLIAVLIGLCTYAALH